MSGNTVVREGKKERTDVATQDVLDLLLLETTLDDKTSGAVDGAGRTHFRKHVLDDVLGLPVHTFANVGDVGEDRLLVAFTCELRRRDCVTFAGGGKEGGVGSVKLRVESVQELKNRCEFGDQQSCKNLAHLLISVVTVALQPRFVPGVKTDAFAGAGKRIVSELALLHLWHQVLLTTLLLIRVFPLGLVQLLFERLQIERSLLRRFLLLFLEIREIEIFRCGCADWGGRARSVALLQITTP